MQVVPLEIRRLGAAGIAITWPDGQVQEICSERLRRACPCATCKALAGDASHDKPITASKSSLRVVEHTSSEALKLERIWPVGSYALGVEWGDKHATGIYTFEFLRSLS